jgi:hypothetical protein
MAAVEKCRDYPSRLSRDLEHQVEKCERIHSKRHYSAARNHLCQQQHSPMIFLTKMVTPPAHPPVQVETIRRQDFNSSQLELMAVISMFFTCKAFAFERGSLI